LELDGFLLNTPEEVLDEALSETYCNLLSNQAQVSHLSNGNLAPLNGLERVADVNIYVVDQIVRRAGALQSTRDAKRGNQVGLNQLLFSSLGLTEGDLVSIEQEGKTVVMPATLEAALAPNAVRISAGTSFSSLLGPMFGPVTVTKA